MSRFFKITSIYILLIACFACESKKHEILDETTVNQPKKMVVYQVFTRLFGNKETTNKPWGTIAENGVGKFADFDDTALKAIKDLGITHIWYTGVPHHALINDYKAYGISDDDPDVVKGRAGSPYAVKDYYNVNPDLAIDPAKRLEEFEALIARTHKHGLKVIIDIVPNHIARKYEGLTNPKGVTDFGANDNTQVVYDRNNNFYYIPNKSFVVPSDTNYKPLGGETHPLADGFFEETPAKWTGNGSREAQPSIHDWYETVKINYGIKPDGSYDFPTLPEGFDKKSYEEHYAFWQDKDLPDSWIKFKDIVHYWLDKGVDGFRYDMAEMVPVHFWSYLNASIKMKNPEAFLLAEVYNPKEYRNYIHLGKMDYLYDKVELYDTLKSIVQGRATPKDILPIQKRLADIEHHMLHFLDNHDEQRLANEAFAGNAENGKPLMVVSTTLSSAPTMIYFGQEVGEKGEETGGFGQPTRTSIFDYVGVPQHQKWMNHGKFDGGQLDEASKKLRKFYSTLLNFSLKSEALTGDFYDLHTSNLINPNYHEMLFAFARWKNNDRIIIITNFDKKKSHDFTINIPKQLVSLWKLNKGKYSLINQLDVKQSFELIVNEDQAVLQATLDPNESLILQL